MGNYEQDCREISRIQFHTHFSRKEKNYLISIIEKRMSDMEQLEIEGNKLNFKLHKENF